MHRRALVSSLALLAFIPPAIPAWAGEDKKKEALDRYVMVGPIAVSTVRPGGRRGVMTVEVQLHAPDPAVQELATLSGPYLRSAYVSVLQRYALGLSPGDPPNPDWIAMALQQETDRVLKRKGARLLLGTILIN